MDMKYLPFLVLIAFIAVAGVAFMRIVELSSGGKGSLRSGRETKIMPYLYMEQLDPDTMRPYKHFPMDELTLWGDGYSISGSHATEGDIRLSGRFEQAQMVHTNHAIVCMDEKGCYITDNDSINHMRLPNSREPVRQVAIENGTVVYLGPQPIRFVFARLEGPDVPSRSRSTQAFTRKSGAGKNVTDEKMSTKTGVYTPGTGPRVKRMEQEEVLDDQMIFRRKPVRRKRPER